MGLSIKIFGATPQSLHLKKLCIILVPTEKFIFYFNKKYLVWFSQVEGYTIYNNAFSHFCITTILFCIKSRIKQLNTSRPIDWWWLMHSHYDAGCFMLSHYRYIILKKIPAIIQAPINRLFTAGSRFRYFCQEPTHYKLLRWLL